MKLHDLRNRTIGAINNIKFRLKSGCDFVSEVLKPYSIKWSSIKVMRAKGVTKFLSFVTIGVPAYATLQATLLSHGIKLYTPANYYYFYIASLTYLLGVALFDLLSPDIIKSYKDQFQYFESWSEHWSKISDHIVKSEKRIQEVISRELDKCNVASGEEIDQSAQRNLERIYDALWDEISLQHRIKDLDEEWRSKDEGYVLARFLSSVPFYVSFTIAAWVTFIDVPARLLSS